MHYRIGDVVEVIDARHRGRTGQIVDIDAADNSVMITGMIGPVHVTRLKLVEIAPAASSAVTPPPAPRPVRSMAFALKLDGLQQCQADAGPGEAMYSHHKSGLKQMGLHVEMTCVVVHAIDPDAGTATVQICKLQPPSRYAIGDFVLHGPVTTVDLEQLHNPFLGRTPVDLGSADDGAAPWGKRYSPRQPTGYWAPED